VEVNYCINTKYTLLTFTIVPYPVLKSKYLSADRQAPKEEGGEARNNRAIYRAIGPSERQVIIYS